MTIPTKYCSIETFSFYWEYYNSIEKYFVKNIVLNIAYILL